MNGRSFGEFRGVKIARSSETALLHFDAVSPRKEAASRPRPWGLWRKSGRFRLDPDWHVGCSSPAGPATPESPASNAWACFVFLPKPANGHDGHDRHDRHDRHTSLRFWTALSLLPERGHSHVRRVSTRRAPEGICCTRSCRSRPCISSRRPRCEGLPRVRARSRST